jgi:hypothetical protein
MFISKLSLPRRTFLRGVGATIALPFLDAMVPALTATAKTAANPAPRFGAVYIPNGAIMDRWIPEKVGAGFEFTPILKPLERFKESVVVVTNLTRSHPGSQVGDHAVSAAGFLTGVWPKRTEAEDVLANTTIDQIIAKQIGQDTVFPSLELATEDFTGYIGGCDTQYACAYMNTLSWASPTQPLPMEINPRVTFERMFGRAGTTAQRLARMQNDRSILDSVQQDVKELQGGLGPKDRARLGDYLENVREIEKRIQKAEKQATTEVAVPDAPIGVPESFEEHVGLQFDLIALAYEANITKVFTFMLSRDASQRVYPNLGFAEPHHSMSHHGNNPEKLANLVKLNTYHVSLFAKFLDKLASTPDGDGSILDHSLIMYGSGMSESDTHSRLNVPIAIAGHGAGLLKGNRHLQAPKETPLANLMLDFANKFGCETDKFGTLSTGRFEI